MRRRRERTARDREVHLELRVDAVAAGAGLRVLRELGEGGTSRVCLVVPRDADPFRPLDVSRAAMKVPRFEIVSDRRVREDRVLAAVRSPHVVALLGTPEVGAETLLLEYLPGGTLAELLARRAFLRVGEAVTIVVSLVRALAALHAAGYWHGSLSASKVMFAADGRPVVVGLSHAVPVSSEPAGASASNGAPDGSGFREIVELVAKAVGDPAIEPAAEVLATLARRGLAAPMDPSAWLGLETRVFGVGRPEPVLLVPPSAAQVYGAGGAVPSAWGDAPSRLRVAAETARGWLDRGRLAGMVKAARAKRKLLVYSTGCLLVAGTAAMTMVAAPATGDQARTVSEAAEAPTRPSGGASSPASTTPALDHPAPTSGASPTALDGTKQDEPVDAAVHLLRARFECFSGKPVDPHCLDALLEPGSALETTDRAELRAGLTSNSASSRDYNAYEVSLIERMGDAVLLALAPSAPLTGTDQVTAQTKPASLLVVRGEAGWRLRELFEN